MSLSFVFSPWRLRWPRLAVLCWLALVGMATARAEADFLPPERAFAFEAQRADGRHLRLQFEVAPGYYLYKERFAFEAVPADTRLGPAVLPAGKVKFDETFQKEVETHRGRVDVLLPVEAAPPAFLLKVTNQGCADQGLCYPPQQRFVKVTVQGGALDTVSPLSATAAEAWRAEGGAVVALADTGPAPVAAAPAAPDEDGGTLSQVLRGGRLWQIAGVFLMAGVLLAFTPCVLPMLPILSSIIVGQRQAGASRSRALGLSALYVLGMALVYTLFGILAGLAGEGLAARLQTPAVLGAFAVVLVLLSLSMFGFYELRLPAALQTRLSGGSSRLPGGQALGVFAMGGVSALIVSPCVAAPLAGALLFISQTRDVWLGGTALFALALGMGLPLLLVGGSADRWLPRTGPWMETVKQGFGFVLLGVAAWLLAPVLPVPVQMLVWAALACLLAGAAWPLGGALGRGVALLTLLLAAAWVAGALSGGRDVWQPLGHLGRGGAATAQGPALPFQSIKGVEALDAALAAAGRPVMLDFYADWCVSCKEMERYTFADARVAERLREMVLLRADVTANDAADRALLKRFQLFGPPGLVFFAPGGQEVAGTRVIGYQDADTFLKVLGRAVPRP
jgi:thiol:disulfide interchange protein DsbD